MSRETFLALLSGGILFGALLCLFVFFSPNPVKDKNEKALLYANPLVAKALLGSYAQIGADIAWLESIKIGEYENGSYHIDKTKFTQTFLVIAQLDPQFFEAINYGVGFLSSIEKDPDSAERILDVALAQNPNDFRLLYVKLLTELTYRPHPDKAKITSLAKQIYANDAFRGYFGAIKIDDFLIDLIGYADNEQQRKNQTKSDLAWLYAHTSDPAKRMLISTRLRELK